jgi:5-methylcytosine-specific restriction endonuclease McrA
MTPEEDEWWRKYNRYLNRHDWQRTRQAVLKRDGNRCVICGTSGSRNNPLQADHLSYAAYNTTGQTSLEDLQRLCRNCHQRITGRQFDGRYPADQHTWGEQLPEAVMILIILMLLAKYC